MKKHLLYLIIVAIVVCLGSCKKDSGVFPDQSSEPNICLVDNRITISDVRGIPEEVSIDKVIIKIQGYKWRVVETVEADFTDGKAVVELPVDIDADKLAKVVRQQASDLEGYWYALADNEDALVAGFNDIVAYYEGERVGRVYLTDWIEGDNTGHSWIYYHYVDRDVALSGTYGSYTYSLSFVAGWNAYRNENRTNLSGLGAVSCTTEMDSDYDYYWCFESGR